MSVVEFSDCYSHSSTRISFQGIIFTAFFTPGFTRSGRVMLRPQKGVVLIVPNSYGSRIIITAVIVPNLEKKKNEKKKTANTDHELHRLQLANIQTNKRQRHGHPSITCSPSNFSYFVHSPRISLCPFPAQRSNTAECGHSAGDVNRFTD